MYDNLDTFTRRRFPLPVRHERGEGEGEGLPNNDDLLSPALSSIVPLEEREQGPCALKEEYCLALTLSLSPRERGQLLPLWK